MSANKKCSSTLVFNECCVSLVSAMPENCLQIPVLPYEDVVSDDLCVENELGIAKTNVALLDLQVAIVQKFGTFAQIGELDYDLISEDQGFNSKILVLRNVWKSDELAVMNNWPTTICAKIATLMKRVSKDASDKEKHVLFLKNFHNVEIDVYEMLSGQKNTLEIYAAQNFEAGSNKGFLLMEYVDDARFCELWKHLCDFQLEQIMIDLAKLHSLTPQWEMNDCRLESNRKGFVEEVLMNRIVDENESRPRLAAAKKFLNDDEVYEQMEELTLTLRTTAPMLFRRASELGLPVVFGHADLWNGNVMFCDDKFKAIIDYQTCHMIQLGFEFGRLFAHFASEDQRSRVLHFFRVYKQELDITWPKNRITEENFLISWELLLPFHYWLAIMCRGGRSWTTKRAKHPATAEETLRSIMKTMTKEAIDGLNSAIKKYL